MARQDAASNDGVTAATPENDTVTGEGPPGDGTKAQGPPKGGVPVPPDETESDTCESWVEVPASRRTTRSQAAKAAQNDKSNPAPLAQAGTNPVPVAQAGANPVSGQRGGPPPESGGPIRASGVIPAPTNHEQGRPPIGGSTRALPAGLLNPPTTSAARPYLRSDAQKNRQ